ncbi:MAG TPA: glycosyltransferase family 4 protein [Nitrospira sp.]|nr:glycosyltransferase family 4 protein [Nitrospira sp.]
MWLLIASCAGLVSWWLTGRLASAASRFVSFDHPNERSLHSAPVPRSGGIAILAGIIAGLAVATVTSSIEVGLGEGSPVRRIPVWLFMLSSTALVTAVSYLDDRRGLPVWLRFMVQTVAAIAAVGGAGLSLSTVTVPGLGTVSLGWLGGPASVLFVLWMTNLYNFMDGMDGFAGGMTVLGFAFLAYFAWRAGNGTLFVAAAVISASALGFLVHNFPPARIFMGDVGSVPIGFTAGLMTLLGVREQLFDLWVPVLIFSPFIIDATVTVLRRAWRAQRIWHAHREHYYQRIVLSGWSHRETVLAEYAVMLCCGGLAMLYHAMDTWRMAILGTWMLLFIGLAGAVHAMEQQGKNDRR